MIRPLELNLASRPFRNNVPIWVGLVALALVIVAFAGWNVHAYLHASGQLGALRASIGSVDRQMADLARRDKEAEKRAKEFDLKTLTAQAAYANEILLRRGLSWTRLFNQLEKVVPYEVHATSIRPLYGGKEAAGKGPALAGVVPIEIDGQAQSLEAFLEFERALIVNPHYAGVEPMRTDTSPGMTDIKFEIKFYYDPEGRLGGEHPDIPHVLEAAKKAAAEGGEASPDALKGLP